MIEDIARAKVNLTLHVGRAIEDLNHPHYGYHPLTSLVVFADFGDRISCKPARETSLEIFGPYGQSLMGEDSNLILKAFEHVRACSSVPNLAFRLEKNLPIASGIGGGSADAAAALRLMSQFVDLPKSSWLKIAVKLGADVPVCFYSKTAVMAGIGEQICLKPGLGQLPSLLVNPGTKVSTAQMFEAFDKADPPELAKPQDNTGSLVERAKSGENSFVSLIPEETAVSEIEDAFSDIEGCELVRMSGSGATFFALFHSEEFRDKAFQLLQLKKPQWWIQKVVLGDQDD